MTLTEINGRIRVTCSQCRATAEVSTDAMPSWPWLVLAFVGGVLVGVAL